MVKYTVTKTIERMACTPSLRKLLVALLEGLLAKAVCMVVIPKEGGRKGWDEESKKGRRRGGGKGEEKREMRKRE